MAKREKQKRGARGRDSDEPKKKVEEAEEARADEDSKEGDADEEETSKKADDDEDEEESSSKDESDDEDEDDGEADRAAGGEESSISKGEDGPSETALAKSEDDGEQSDEDADADAEELAATQLGIDRYVLAGFFASGMLGAYILGRTIQALWANFANKDWFNQSLPRLAGVADDDKTSYSLVLSGIIAVIVVFRTYRRRDVREWCDEVASELAKVVWPSRKEVQNYTFVVIAASAFATIYLTVLDRLWAFITNLVYGDGS